MPKRITDGHFAIGLFVGIVLTALACSVLQFYANKWWHWDGALVSSSDTLANWIMMTFTVIAAGLLLGTLNVTRKMASDGKRIGDMQNRAWLKCGLEIPGGLYEAQESLPFGMRLNVTNIGKSAATNVLADVFLFQSLNHGDEGIIEGLRASLIRKVETEHERPGIILPSETVRRHRAEALRVDRTKILHLIGGVLPAACVVVVYKTAEDNDWRCTATVFDIYVKDAGGGGLGFPFSLDGQSIPAANINVIMRRNAMGT